MKRLGRYFLYFMVGVVAAAGGWLTIGSAIAANRLEQARQRWEKENEPLASFLARHRPVKKNASARELERLAAAVGINIRPRSEMPAIDEDHPLAASLRQSSEQLSSWARNQMEKQGPETDPVPEKVAALIRERRGELLAVEKHLIDHELPVWTFDATFSPSAEIPNLLGHMQLARLLSAHAITARDAGAIEEAWQAAHALQRLSESLQPQPVLITQLIAIAIAKHETTIARKLPAPVPAWRLAKPLRDRRNDVIDSLIAEQLLVDRSSSTAEFFNVAGPKPKPAQLLLRPAAVLAAANLWDVNAAVLREYRKTNLCDMSIEKFASAAASVTSDWNSVASMLTPNYGSVFIRLRNLELAEEMTRKVLEAKEARRLSANQWPESITGIETSLCSSQKWSYSASAGDGMKLAMLNPPATPRSVSAPDPFVYAEK